MSDARAGAKRPNILILMVDQLNGTLFPDGPAEFLHAPNLKKLAERSVRFSKNYTASPLCAPGRASFMSGQLPRRTRVYDNAAEFASDIPTYAHHLRRAGYYTCLSGKMHFVGPDQMHGFEERLTTDIYPAAGRQITASPESGSTGGITISVRSPAQVSPKPRTRWNMMTRSRSSLPRSCTNCPVPAMIRWPGPGR